MSTPPGLQQLLTRFGKTYAPGEWIFREGDTGQSVFFLIRGNVEVRLGERVLCTLGPGDVFGEMALFNEAPRSAGVVVTDAVQVLDFDKDSLYSHITLYPELAVRLLRLMTQRMQRMDRELKAALSHTDYSLKNF